MRTRRVKVFGLPFFKAFVVTIALSLVFMFLHSARIAAANPPQKTPSPIIVKSPASTTTQPVTENNITYLPIEQQTFYPQLEKKKANFSSIVKPAGYSPQETFLDFYVSMAQIYHGLGDLMKDPFSNNDLFWSADVKSKAQVFIDKFEDVLEYFDFSQTPISVKHSVSMSTTMQLKEIFDYVISHSEDKIDLYSDFKAGQKVWRFPETLYTIIRPSDTPASPNPGSIKYTFSKEIIDLVNSQYPTIASNTTVPALIDPKNTNLNWFYTPNLDSFESLTPGYLLVPKWYLMLPVNVRHILEIADSSTNTIGEYIIFAIVLIVSLILLSIIFRAILKLTREEHLEDTNEALLDNTRLFHSIGFLSKESGLHQRHHSPDEILERTSKDLEQIKYGVSVSYRNDSKIFFLLGLCVLICANASHTIEYFANISGLYFQLSKGFYDTLIYINGSYSVYVVVKLIGLYYVKFPYLGSKKRKRVTVADLKRLLSSVSSVASISGYVLSLGFLYGLLTDLGLPSETVLAFSAVPGLAIGLGASKVLSNIFAAISIKGDRPIEVGDFCEINGIKGFVLSIGVRSVVINTPDGLVTIPNSKVDEETIVNYSYSSEEVNSVKLVTVTAEYNFTKPFSSNALSGASSDTNISYMPLDFIEGWQRPFSTATLNKVERELNNMLEELEYVYDYYVDMEETYGERYGIQFKGYIGAQIESWKDYFALTGLFDNKVIELLVNIRESSDVPPVKNKIETNGVSNGVATNSQSNANQNYFKRY